MARKEQKQWYRLDNAGVLYSALKKEKYAPVYRFSAVMKETVDPDALQRRWIEPCRDSHASVCGFERAYSGAILSPTKSPGPLSAGILQTPASPSGKSGTTIG